MILKSPGVLALSGCRFVEGLAAGAILVALPGTVGRLGETGSIPGLPETTGIGLLVAAFGISLALGQPLVGRLADRGVSPRALAVLGLVGFAALSAPLAWVTTFGELLLLRAFQGLSMALVVPTTVSLLTGIVPAESRGRALGFFNSAKTLGLGVGPILGGGLLTVTTPEWTYGLGAGLVLVASLPLLAIDNRELSAPSRPGPPPGQAGGAETFAAVSCGVLGFGAFVASSSATSLVVLQNDFAARMGPATFGFGLAIAAMMLTRMALNWPVGVLTDRLSRVALLNAGLVILALGTLLLGVARSPLELILLRILCGVGMTLFSIPCFALVARGPNRTRSIARVTTGFSLGVGIGPLLTGLWAGQFGLEAPFIAWSALALVASALLTLPTAVGRFARVPATPPGVSASHCGVPSTQLPLVPVRA